MHRKVARFRKIVQPFFLRIAVRENLSRSSMERILDARRYRETECAAYGILRGHIDLDMLVSTDGVDVTTVRGEDIWRCGHDGSRVDHLFTLINIRSPSGERKKCQKKNKKSAHKKKLKFSYDGEIFDLDFSKIEQ